MKISRKLDEKEEVNKERNMGIENKGEMRERNKKRWQLTKETHRIRD